MASDWNPGSAPNGSTADAVIAAPGLYTVTYNSLDNADLLDSVTIAAGDATLAVSALLTLGGSQHLLAVQAGTLALVGGDIQNATVSLTGGVASFANSDTLDHVTWQGRLSPGGGTTLVFKNGLTVTGVGGTGFGTIDLLSGSPILYELDSETLDNVAILMGGSSLIEGSGATGQSLTFEAHATVTQRSGSIQFADPTIVNLGTFNLSGGTVNLNTPLMNNGGLITLANNESVSVAGSLVNTGSINVAAYTTLTTGTLSGTGAITVGTGALLQVSNVGTAGLSGVSNSGTVVIGGTIGQSALNGISGSGLLDLTGTLNLAGGTLSLGAGVFANFREDGTIQNGTISQAAGTLALGSQATLAAAAVWGALSVTGTLRVSGGLTLTGASGLGIGTLDLSAGSRTMYVSDAETLDNVAILLGGYSDIVDIAAPLTLGTHGTLTQTSGFGYLDSYNSSGLFNNAGLIVTNGYSIIAAGATLANAGSIAVGSGFFEANNTLTNTGVISVAAGGTLVAGGTLLNTGTITVATGGTAQIAGLVGLATLAGLTGGGLIDVIGTLNLGGGTLNLGSGTFGNLRIDGTIENGTINQTGGTLQLGPNATLLNDTVLGTLIVGSPTYVTGGLVVETATGGLPGTIDMSSSSSTLHVTDSETLDNVTILLGRSANLVDNLGTLTLGTHATLSQVASLGYIDSFNQGGVFVNAGLIATNGHSLHAAGATLVNAGSIAIGSGTLQVYNTLNNTGAISIGAGGTLSVGAMPLNSGTIAVSAGGTVVLGGLVTTAELAGISGAGLVDITGTLNLAGGTLNLGTLSFGALRLDGVMSNGTLVEGAGSLSVGISATLTAMTVQGSLATTGLLYLSGGLTLETAAGGLPASLAIAAGAPVLVTDGETLDNMSILLGSGGQLAETSGGTLSLGSHATLTAAGGTTYLNYGYSGSAANAGSIVVSAGTFTEDATSLVNTGSIAITNALFYLQGATLTNTGSISVGAGGTLELPGTNGLFGSGSLSVAAGGTLEYNGGNITPSQLPAITGGGTLWKNGGTFDLGSGTLTLNPITGIGNLLIGNYATLQNGTIIESGGSLALQSYIATLSNVTVRGSLALTNNVTIDNALSVLSLDGTQPGTLDFTQTGGGVYFNTSTTLDNLTALLGSSDIFVNYGSETLTFGSNSTVTQSSGFAEFFGLSGDRVITKGVMALSGGTLLASVNAFENAGMLGLSNSESFSGSSTTTLTNDATGTISIGAYTTLSLTGSQSFSNAGKVMVGPLGGLMIGSGVTFTNAGTIALDPAGTFDLNASATLSALGAITGGGTLIVESGRTLNLGGGTLELGTGQSFATLRLNGGSVVNGTLKYDATGGLVNSGGTITATVSGSSAIGVQTTINVSENLAGGTLDIKSGSGTSNVLLSSGGTLANGTLKLESGVFTASYGTLSAMTVMGALTLNSNVASIRNGLTFQSVTGGLPGSLTLNGSSVLSALDAETLDNVGIVYSGNGVLASGTATLTLGSHATISQATPALASGALTGTGFTSQGLITASTGFTDGVASFANAGTIAVTGTGDFLANGTSLINSGLISIGTGGTFDLSTSVFSSTGTISIASGGTLNLNTAVTLASLGVIQAASGAVINIRSTLDVGGGTLDLLPGTAAGALVPTSTGTIRNATLKPDGNGVTLIGTLDNVTLLGAQSLTSSVAVKNGLVVETAAGGLPGALSLAGSNVALTVLDSETLDNFSITEIGNNNTISENGTGTLTLGSHATLTASAPINYYGIINGSTVVNRGLIQTTGLLYDNASSLVNVGSIVTSGMFVAQGSSFTNAGVLSISAGGTAELFSTALANTGSITVAAGGTLIVQGSYTLAQLGSIAVASGGVVDLNGTLNLGGGTLDVAPGTAFCNVVMGTGADIIGGTIKADGGTLALAGTLDGVTLLGSETLSSTLSVKDGLVVDTAAGAQPGTLTVGTQIILNVLDTETLDNMVIAGSGTLGGYGVMTLGSHASVLVNGPTGTGVINGSTTTNRGQIQVLTQLYGSAATFINAGTISVSPGGYFFEQSYTFANTGLLAIAAGGTTTISGAVGNFSNTGMITVASQGTLNMNGNATLAQLGSLTVASGGLIQLGGTLNLGGATLDIAAGNPFGNLVLNGDLVNGTLKADGGALTLGGTLDGVTLLGADTLTTTAYVKDGLVVETTAGGLPGTLTIASQAVLNVQDSETLDNIVIAGAGTLNGTGGLTLGSHATLIATAHAGATNVIGGGTVINRGQIQVLTSLYGSATNLTNAGTISVSSHGYFFEQSYTFANTGLLAIAVGGTTSVSGSVSSFSNTGTITVASQGTLLFNDNLTLAQIGSITVASGGLLQLAGTLDLGGGTIDMRPGTAFGNLSLSGTIKNGTLLQDGGTLAVNGGTLDGVKVVGTLTNTTGGSLYYKDGLTLSGPGSTQGTIDLQSTSAALSAIDTETLDNVTVLLGTGSSVTGNANLTIGTHALISAVHGAGAFTTYSGTLTNNGVISLSDGTISTAGQVFLNAGSLLLDSGFRVVTGGTFTNTGLIDATANSGTEALITTNGTLSNLAGGTLTGGTWEVDDGTTLDVQFGGTISTDAASITLSGPNSALMVYAPSPTNGYAAIETTLATIAATGTLSLLAGRSWAGSLAMTEAGLLQLGGGVFTEASLAIAATGTVLGYGTLAVGVTDAGRIEAHGGDLVLGGTLSGGAAVTIDAGATLELSADPSSAVVFNGLGARLKIDVPGASVFDLANVTAGDGLILAGVPASSAVTSGNTLTVTLQGSGTETFHMDPALTGIREGVTQDGAGNSSVVFYRKASAAGVPQSPLNIGQHHTGDYVYQSVTITNTAAADGYSEALDVSVTGISGAVGSVGSISLLAAGASSSAIAIGLLTASAGAETGQAVIVVQTDGTGTDANAALTLSTQTLNVTGSVYNYATASVGTASPIHFANHHVGDVVLQTVTLANAAAADGYSENLDASVASVTGGLSGQGSVSGLAAGASSTAITLALGTATAGAFSGTATLNLLSDGTGIDNLGTTVLTAQTIAATGTLYGYATASNVGSVNFGVVHVGSLASQALSLRNLAATGGYGENLDATIATATSGLSASGTVSGLAAGAASTALGVTLATATAGVISGSATLALASDGGSIDGLGITQLSGQTIAVTGTVYNVATASLLTASPIRFANHHVGDVVSQSVTLTNAAAAGGYSENLDASVASVTGGLSGQGSVSSLAAGASSTAITLALGTATAGAIAGTATLNLLSDGAGIDNLGTTVLTAQTIAATGTLYSYATASNVGSVNFGVVHVGSLASQALSLRNLAATDGYGENLDATIATATSGLSTSGTVSGLAAGAASTALGVTLATASSGVISGTATLALASDGTGIDGLGITQLTGQTIAVTGIVDSYAVGAFAKVSGAGTLQQTGSTSWVLNLGSIVTAATVNLGVLNAATGLADLLSGSLSVSGSGAFVNSGLANVGSLAAGAEDSAPTVTLQATNTGTYSETITFAGTGSNANYSGAVAADTLTVTGVVLSKPLITGISAGQTVIAGATLTPFATVAITDANVGQTETVTITPSASGRGTFTNLAGFVYNATAGSYTDTGTAAAVTAAIDALVFTPTASLTATTGFTLGVTDSDGVTATDSTTTVTASRTLDFPANTPNYGSGTGLTITLGANASLSFSGNANSFTLGTNDVLAPQGNTNTVAATAGDTIYLGAVSGDIFTGAGFDVSASAAASFSIGGTGAGASDLVTGGGATVSVLAGSAVQFYGDGYTITLNGTSTLAPSGNNNTITATGTDNIWLGVVTGDTITGAGFVAHVISGTSITIGGNGAGPSDLVAGTGGTIDVLANSTSTMYGDGNTITLGANSVLAPIGNNDMIAATSGNNIWLGPITGDTITGAGFAAHVVAGTSITVGGNGTGSTDFVAGAGATIDVQAGSTVTAYGDGNTIILGANATLAPQGNNDVITATTGDQIYLGGVVGETIDGAGFTVHGGGGGPVTLGGGGSANATDTAAGAAITWDLLLGSHATFYGDGSTVNSTGSSTYTVSGSGDVVTAAAGDTVTDSGYSLLVKVGFSTGTLSLASFGSDTAGVIDLMGGAGGYATANAAWSALADDGHGNSSLALGASGNVQLTGVTKEMLSAANFRIG